MTVSLLVLHDAASAATVQLADAVAHGARNVEGATSFLRSISDVSEADLISADGLILGLTLLGDESPLLTWLGRQGGVGGRPSLGGKAGGMFATGGRVRAAVGGPMASALRWMLGSGMVVIGLPESDKLGRSGSPYGATATTRVSVEDLEQARSLGQRVAQLTVMLNETR